MKRYQLLQVTSPLVELECGGHSVRTKHIPNTKKNPNFPKPVVSMDVVSSSYYACQVARTELACFVSSN